MKLGWLYERSFWDGSRRHVVRNTPRGTAYCEECSERLNYDYGSIRWQCRERDLCPSCWGSEQGKVVAEKIKAAFAAKGEKRD
jgi:hypothetical protein